MKYIAIGCGIYFHLHQTIHSFTTTITSLICVATVTLYMIMRMGNSTTISFDVEDSRTAKLILLSLTETVCMRLRDAEMLTKVVCVSIKSKEFISWSHQMQLSHPTDITKNIYEAICKLFDESWNKQPIRHLGVRVTGLSSNVNTQLSLFDFDKHEKLSKLDSAIDKIRYRYGKKSVIRASFLHSGIRPLNGGMPTEEYPVNVKSSLIVDP